MQIERVPVRSLAVGDVVSVRTASGWWTVTAIGSSGPDGAGVTLTKIGDGEVRHADLLPGDVVHRTDPAAVHHRDEFLGMTVTEARAWAGALGWTFRHRGSTGVGTDDLRGTRIDVWTDPAGIVVRAELG